MSEIGNILAKKITKKWLNDGRLPHINPHGAGKFSFIEYVKDSALVSPYDNSSVRGAYYYGKNEIIDGLKSKSYCGALWVDDFISNDGTNFKIAGHSTIYEEVKDFLTHKEKTFVMSYLLGKND